MTDSNASLPAHTSLADLPCKRARTESVDRADAFSHAVHASQSPPRDCAARLDTATPHLETAHPSHRGSVSGLSPDSVASQDGADDAQRAAQVAERGTTREDGAEEVEEEEGLLMVTPTTSLLTPTATSEAAMPVPLAAGLDSKISSTAFRVLASRAAAKPQVNKALTTLHSLQHLEHLLAPGALQPSRRVVQPAASLERPSALQLHAGETVMFLVHQGKDALDALVNEHTVEMSMMRIFTLDVAALPPQDYEVGHRTGPLPAFVSASDNTSRDLAPTAAGAASSTGGAHDDRDEEETLITPARPQSLASHASTMMDLIEADSLSNQLQHAMDPVMERLTRLFQVDTALCPWLSFGLDGGHHGAASTSATQKTGKDAFPMPAMVVWRARGAAHDEYPPAPPQTYSSQPMASQPVQFPDRMAQQGGPLVVKEVHTVDQVHSLSLWQPVYTLPHLLRTVVDSIRAHPAHRTGDTGRGRSVMYLGASWCPPCMRIVGELPLLTVEGLPPTVHTWMKADMDFAKPIFDFFKVEIIPTFIVLENAALLECDRKLQTLVDPTERKEALEAAFAKADLGHLQNSSRPTVSLFIEKNSKSLSFDDDF